MKKTAAMNPKRCAACGACMKVCPREALRIESGCFAVVSADRCVGCGMCAKICPANCIRLEERGGAHA